MRVLTTEEIDTFKIPWYSAPALALLNQFEPCPSQNPGYATGFHSTVGSR